MDGSLTGGGEGPCRPCDCACVPGSIMWRPRRCVLCALALVGEAGAARRLTGQVSSLPSECVGGLFTQPWSTTFGPGEQQGAWVSEAPQLCVPWPDRSALGGLVEALGGFSSSSAHPFSPPGTTRARAAAPDPPSAPGRTRRWQPLAPRCRAAALGLQWPSHSSPVQGKAAARVACAPIGRAHTSPLPSACCMAL